MRPEGGVLHGQESVPRRASVPPPSQSDHMEDLHRASGAKEVRKGVDPHDEQVKVNVTGRGIQ